MKSQQAIHNDNRIVIMKNDIIGYRKHLKDVESALSEKKKELATTETLIRQLGTKNHKVESETNASRLLLDRASSLVTEYDSQTLAQRKS